MSVPSFFQNKQTNTNPSKLKLVDHQWCAQDRGNYMTSAAASSADDGIRARWVERQDRDVIAILLQQRWILVQLWYCCVVTISNTKLLFSVFLL